MRWFWQKRKDSDVIDYIKAVLFPPVKRYIEEGTEFFVDGSVDANIEAVKNDLDQGIYDEMTVNTLNFILGQLRKVRAQYNIPHEIKPDVTTTTYRYMVSANEQRDI